MMSSQSITSVRRVSGFAGAAVAVALLASACASSGSGKSGGGTNQAGGGGTTNGVKVEAHSGPMGTYLTDGSGKSLYVFESDSATKSSCNATCTVYWPPLIGTAQASGGASAGQLSTITRSDGSKQVAYAGHPLYYYKEDGAAGDTKGQGSDEFGAKWWLVAPTGKAITGSGSGGAASSSSSSSGGGGWG